MNARQKIGGVLAIAGLGMVTVGIMPASATGGSDHKEDICHPKEGGWVHISVDKASSHFDQYGNPKHEHDGRVDTYSVNGLCPGEETTSSSTTSSTSSTSTTSTTSSSSSESSSSTSSTTSTSSASTTKPVVTHTKNPVVVKPRRVPTKPTPVTVAKKTAPPVELAYTGPMNPELMWSGIAALLLGAVAYLGQARLIRVKK